MKCKFKLFSIIGLILAFASCNNTETPTISAPDNFKIVDNTITFTEIDGAKNKAVIWANGQEGQNNYRLINSGTTIDELNLSPGEYFMYVEITLNGQTVKTETISFVIEDLDAVKEVGASEMINSNLVKLIGRNFYEKNKDVVMMPHAGSGFTVRFKGTSLKADLYATNSMTNWKRPYISVIVDGNYDNPTILSLHTKNTEGLTLVEGLSYGEHEVTVIKRSESLDSFYGVSKVYSDGKLLDRDDKERFIEIIGDSTIAGYGNETKYVNGKYEDKTSANSNIMKTFGYITANKLNADYSIVCASGWGLTGSIWTTPQTVNLFETYRRYYATYDDITKKHVYSNDYYNFSEGRKADVVIISVGTNDLYYIEDGYKQSNEIGSQRKQDFIDKYKELVEMITSMYEGVEIFMVYGAMGEIRMYSTVESAYKNINKTLSNVHLVKLNGDQKAIDYHPSAKSHEEMATVLIDEIKKIKNW